MQFKTWRGLLLTGLFLFTFLAVGSRLYLERPQAAKEPAAKAAWQGRYERIAEVNLGDAEVRGFNHMGSIRAYMEFSADEKRLAIGTDSGEILLLESADGRILWRSRVGIGRIMALTFSPDGRCLYVGESSPEGRLLCLDSGSGDKLWEYRTAEDIGVDLRHGSLPGVVKIICDRRNNLYFLSKRYENDKKGGISYKTKLYCYSQNGEKRWAAPEKSNLDAWVDWISVDESSETLVFGTANISGRRYEFNDSLYYLNAKTGETRRSVRIEGVEPYETTAMRGSPNISADGRFVAAMASDGRAFLYDGEGNQLWRRTLSEPKKVGGVYLNAVGRDAFVVGDQVVFSTLNTYNSANWQLPTPVEHPSGNSVYVFNKAGEFLYRWQAGGAVEDIAFAYPRAAVAVGKNTKTHRTEVHGLRVLNLATGEVTAEISTEGPAIAASLSQSGRYTAIVEVPIKKDDGVILGSYTLRLFKER